jgi:hypothetical protein
MNREQVMEAWRTFEGLWSFLRDDYFAHVDTLPAEHQKGAIAGFLYIERRIRASREPAPADTARLE